MLYNNEMLSTLSLESSPRSINILLHKLLSLRRLEYLVVDRELRIQEISLNAQDFADIPDEVGKGKDVRDSFPERSELKKSWKILLKNESKTFS